MKKLSDLEINETLYVLIKHDVIDDYDDSNVWKKHLKDNLNKKRNIIELPVKLTKRYQLELIQEVDNKRTFLFKDFHFEFDSVIGFLDKNHEEMDKNIWYLIDKRLSIIKKNIEERVFGQEAAKAALISSLISMELNNFFGKTRKSCLLISGPSGSGKTELLRSIPGSLYNVSTFDCSNLTAAGYKGTNVDDLVRLIKAEKEKYPHHPLIVFLDEFDKIAIDLTENSTRNLLQSNLLKIIEGTYYKLPATKDNKQVMDSVDTSDVLFVCAGAFSKIEKEKLDTQDLIEYGILPELVGRMTHITNTIKLDRNTLKNIFLNAETSCLVRAQTRLKLFNVQLEASDDFINEALNVAESSPLGVRALEQVLQEQMNPYWIVLNDFIGKTIYLGAPSGQKLSPRNTNPLLNDE